MYQQQQRQAPLVIWMNSLYTERLLFLGPSFLWPEELKNEIQIFTMQTESQRLAETAGETKTEQTMQAKVKDNVLGFRSSPFHHFLPTDGIFYFLATDWRECSGCGRRRRVSVLTRYRCCKWHFPGIQLYQLDAGQNFIHHANLSLEKREVKSSVHHYWVKKKKNGSSSSSIVNPKVWLLSLPIQALY